MFLPNSRDILSVGQLDREDLVEGFQSVIAYMVRERSSPLRMSKEGEDVFLKYVRVKIRSSGATTVSAAISFYTSLVAKGSAVGKKLVGPGSPL